MDADSDGDPDLLLGTEGCSALNLLYNAKSLQSNLYDSFYQVDSLFPGAGNRASVYIYPSAFYLDVDADGRNDLIVAPSSTTGQYFIEEMDQIQWFRNLGNDQWAPKDAFLSRDVLDLGAHSSWDCHDWDGDGDLDCLATSNGNAAITNNEADRIFLFENIGNTTTPVFKLQNTDFGQFANQSIRNLCISIADMDNDGKQDLVCGNETGEIQYRRHLFRVSSCSSVHCPDSRRNFLIFCR
jgi:hypothetical protein